MKPSSNMSSCFYIFLLFFSICISCVRSSSHVSYRDHCSSIVPESSATVRSYNYSIPSLDPLYLTGGKRLLGWTSNQSYYQDAAGSLGFPTDPVFYETNDMGIYKIEASFYIESIQFVLSGFWSDVTRLLCMVGSASWQAEEGKVLVLDAVLKMKYASYEAPTINNSITSGTLKSTASPNDSRYFDPIKVFSFPVISVYRYSLVTNVTDGGLASEVPRSRSQRLEESRFYAYMSSSSTLYEMEYPGGCKRTKNCSPVGKGDGSLPRSMYLYPIDSSSDGSKLRYWLTFQHTLEQTFSLNSAMLAEGMWDDERNELLIVACRIVNASAFGGIAIDDCSVRMSVRYNSIFTVRNSATIIGKIWTNRTVGHLGYFKPVNLTSLGDSWLDFPGGRFEYTRLDRIRLSCPMKKLDENKKGTYPIVPDHMKDIYLKYSEGMQFAWSYAAPLSVGSEFYGRRNPMSLALALESDHGNEKSLETPLSMSYLLTILPPHNIELGNLFPTANWSVNPIQQMEIVAEGIYDARTGHLCMLGCRKLSSFFRNSTDDSRDCEILVRIDFAPLDEKEGSRMNGTIISTREKTDHLYFEVIGMSYVEYHQGDAERSFQRRDFEKILSLVSDTLLCLFIALQLFHVKRNPEVISGISLFMLVVLSLGFMIPLVLNFGELFSTYYEIQKLRASNGTGWIDITDVAVSIITNMPAFLLQLRLFQLVWTAKKSDKNKMGSWVGERKTAFIAVPLYVCGALLTLLSNRSRYIYNNPNAVYFILGSLSSYAILILDGFLMPQILLNAFRGSEEKSFSLSFYIGISALRLAPYAYDLCRAHYDPKSYVIQPYYYAIRGVDFHSTAWDVIIPCGIIGFAAVVFLQQRLGGRCILPKRFREPELLYERFLLSKKNHEELRCQNSKFQ